MDTLVSGLLSAGLFYAFVPGVLVTLPKGGDRITILVVHAVLFAVTASFVMKWYWSMRENMGNYGLTCPNGYVMQPDKTCVAIGRQTYDVSSALVQ